MSRESSSRASALVAAGIMLSRLAGFVRVAVFAHYFGLKDTADAFYAAFRIPNVLQNLFGEGALSASFIPVYAGLLSRGRGEDADRAARTVFALLSLVTSGLVLLGVLLAPSITPLIAPGYRDEKRTLTIALVRILFPGAGLLVMSAWCLGVLNSHRKFFISYTAPVIWNVSMIATMLAVGRGGSLDRLAIDLAIGSVVGSALQFGVQLPAVLSVFRAASAGPLLAIDADVRTIVRNFVPALISRGVVQVSAYIDVLLASLLDTGAVAALSNAQVLYTLPVSLFGISISAAELPAMSGEVQAEALAARLTDASRRVAFFVVPSAAAFFACGDLIAGAVLQIGRGRFESADAVYVWGILAGSAIGLLASTLARLYSAAYYALGDTRTPLRYAIVRVALVTGLGYVCAILLPPALGFPTRWGAAGLTASAGLAGWCEFALLRRGVSGRVGPSGIGLSRLTRLWVAASAGAIVASLIRWRLTVEQPQLRAALVLIPFGLTFLGTAAALRIPLPSLRRRSA